MRVIFANVYLGLLYEGKKDKTDVFSKYAPSVYAQQYAALEPDVICLAEVPMDSPRGASAFLDDLADRMGAKSAHGQVRDKSWLMEGKYYGSAMLSRYELVGYESILLDNPNLEVVRPNGDRWRMNDAYLQSARVQVHGSEIKLFGVHYFPFYFFKRKLGSVEFEPLRRKFVDALGLEEKNPVIVAADFNNGNGTLAAEFPELFESGQLRSAVDFAKEDFDEKYVGGKFQMDHILYSPTGLAVSGGSVVRDHSDHHGIVADFEVL